MEQYIKKVEGYMGSNGYVGINSDVITNESDVIKFVKSEFKKSFSYKLKGRKSLFAGGSSITMTLQIEKEKAFKGFTDLTRFQIIKASTCYNQIYLDGERYDSDYNFTDEMIKQMYENLISKNMLDINLYYFREDLILSDEAKKAIDLIDKLQKSCNYDYSNSMVDYFETGFYFTLCVELM